MAVVPLAEEDLPVEEAHQEVFKNKCRDILGKFGDCPGGFGDVP